MKLFNFIAFYFLIAYSTAADSNEYSDEAENSTSSANEADFVVIQSPEEAMKVESVEVDFDNRFEEGPADSIPEEQGNAFQGDIILSPEQRERMFDTSVVEERVGFLDEDFRWPKNKGGRVIVPYVIDSVITAEQRTKISQAMRKIEDVSCVRFRARKTQANYVYIRPHKSNCQAYMGKKKTPGSQLLELAPGCFEVGTIMHELIHALGYTHMQNHPFRDLFVKIHRNRIADDKWHNFAPVNVREYGNFDTPYDFLSIMHYPRSSFARKGLPKNTVTIEPVEKYKKFRNLIGERNKLSKGDIKRINNMYKCSV